MNDRHCDGCGDPVARIRVYQTRGSDFSELWLCGGCAESLGVEGGEPAFAPTVSEILGVSVGGTPNRACPACGTKFRAIRQSGRVGCAECYRTFRSRIQYLLEQTGFSEPHAGRYPIRLGAFKRLLVDREKLRERLDKALSEENYEQAVTIRDQMRSLEEHTGADF
jgi:protein arginine kinase activator